MNLLLLISISLFSISAFATPLKLDASDTSESALANSKMVLNLSLDAETFEEVPHEEGKVYHIKAPGTVITYNLLVNSNEHELKMNCRMNVESRIGAKTIRFLKTNDGKVFVLQKSEISPYKDIKVSLSVLLYNHKCLNEQEVNYSLTLKNDIDPIMAALFKKKPMIITGKAYEFSWGSYICTNGYRIGYDYYCSANAKGLFTVKNLMGTDTVATTNEIETLIFHGMWEKGWVQRLMYFKTNEVLAIDHNFNWNRTEFRSPIVFYRELWPSEPLAIESLMTASFQARVSGTELVSFERVYPEGYVVSAVTKNPVSEGKIYFKPKELEDGSVSWDYYFEGRPYEVTLRSTAGNLEVGLQNRGNGADIVAKNHQLLAYIRSAKSLKLTLPSGKAIEPVEFRYSFFDFNSPNPPAKIPTYFEIKLNSPQERISPQDCRIKENFYLTNYRDLKCVGNSRTKLKGSFLVKRIGEELFLVGVAKDFW